jgi:hypothetical protein
VVPPGMRGELFNARRLRPISARRPAGRGSRMVLPAPALRRCPPSAVPVLVLIAGLRAQAGPETVAVLTGRCFDGRRPEEAWASSPRRTQAPRYFKTRRPGCLSSISTVLCRLEGILRRSL